MYYLLTPVTTPPKKEGSYIATYSKGYSENVSWRDGEWRTANGFKLFANITHYLAPVEEPGGMIAMKALEEIANNEGRCCQRCEGNGRLWADGKAHLPSHNGDLMNCGECGGSGKIYEDIQSIAIDALEEIERQRPAPLCVTVEQLREVVTKIFYSPATNGRAEASIEAGIAAVAELLNAKSSTNS